MAVFLRNIFLLLLAAEAALFGLDARATVLPLRADSPRPLAVIGQSSLLAQAPLGAPLAVAAGDESFFIDPSFDSAGREQLTARLAYESQRGHFYVEDDYWNGLAAQERSAFQTAVEGLGQELDNNIFPKLTGFLGDIWTPGIDNDPKITVLLVNLAGGAGGYFNPKDEFPRSQFINSNEREIVYLNVRFLALPRMRAFLAHEFQHLITFNQKDRRLGQSDDIWLNEARSEYAPTFLGYDQALAGSNLGARLDQFLKEPQDSLTEWQGLNRDYGQVNLFSQYLADHFGQEIFPAMMRSSQVGIASVEDALSSLGQGISFPELYGDWLMADFFNEPSLEQGQMAYTNPALTGLQVPATAAYGILGQTVIQRVNAVKPWEPRWFAFVDLNGAGRQNLTLTFQSQPYDNGHFAVRYIKEMADGQKFVNEFSAAGGVVSRETIADFGGDFKRLYVLPYLVERRNYADETLPLVPYQLSISTAPPAAPVENTPETPVVTAIEPPQVLVAGSDPVTVRGQGLTAVNKLLVDGQPVAFTPTADGLSFSAPAGAAGPKTISFELADGRRINSPLSLTYLPLRPEGALIRARGDFKVYIVKGRFKRHILNPTVFGFYGHLKWENVIDISPEELALYAESRLIRAAGDRAVYQIDEDGRKHWLNMPAAAFAASGRDWASVYLVNQRERDFYKKGADITS